MLAVLALTGLLAKLLVVGRAISPGPFPQGNAPFAASVAIVAALALPTMLMRPRARLWTLLIINVAGTTIALADVWHLRFFGDVTSVSEIEGLWQAAIVASSLPSLIRPLDLLAVMDIAIIAAALLAGNRVRARWIAVPRPALSAAALAALVVAGSIWTWLVVRGDPDEVFEYAYQRQHVVGAVGIAGYHVYDIGVNLLFPVRGRLAAEPSRIDELEEVLDARRRQQVRSRLAGIGRGLNVILLSAESLQGFLFDVTIDGQPIAPHLSAFARESLHFTQFYDQTHMGTTADARFVSLNSLMPLRSSAIASRYAANDFRALPHVLQELGYQTLSACAEPAAVWNMAQMHPKFGFARNLFDRDFVWTETVGVGLDDAAFFEQLRPVLKSERAPFLAYLISSSNHHPYRIPAHLQRLRGDSLPEGMAGDYLQSVRYFDEAFGQFIAGLEQDGVLDNTMFVLFGDHQSWVDDQDLERLWKAIGHTGPATPAELWQFRRSVPLLIRLPRGLEAGPRDSPGGHLDITPTLLSLLGVEDESGPWLGRDLTAPSPGIVTFRDQSVTNGETTILRLDDGSETCFQRDGTAVKCEWLDRLREEAREILATSDRMIEANLSSSVRVQDTMATARPLPRVLTIAHRGNSSQYPENTIEAIRSAFDLGADAVEIDIRLSRDGVPVIFHDDTLDRTTNARGAFEERTLVELKSLDAGSWMSPRFSGARIPTLEEALHIARGRGSLLLDLKVDGLARPIHAVYQRAGVKPSEAFIAGWTQAQRSEFLREMPRARILKTDAAPVVWGNDLFDQMRREGLWGFEVGDYWPPPFIGDAVQHGVPVIAYTINDEATMRRLIEAGVSGIETDNPALMLRVAVALGAR